jgi:hypothetical protein
MGYSAAMIRALLLACVLAALSPATLQGNELFDVSQADNVAITALLKSSELPGPWWIERPLALGNYAPQDSTCDDSRVYTEQVLASAKGKAARSYDRSDSRSLRLTQSVFVFESSDVASAWIDRSRTSQSSTDCISLYLAGSSGAKIFTNRVEPTATVADGVVSNAYEIHRPNSGPIRWESYSWSNGNATTSLRFLGPP